MSWVYNRQELANKIDWEGGIFEMLFGYGLSRENIDSRDEKLLMAFDAVDDLKNEFQKRVDNFMFLLPEPGNYDA
jgi:hypothetical protein